ncbi:MAG TPA: hypothetical protein VGG64_07565 [Pirellulales bacterium]|jgi:hypothetical protein
MYKKGESIWSADSILGVNELQARFAGAGIPIVIKRSGFKGYLDAVRTDAWEFVVTRDLGRNENVPLQRLVIHMLDYHNERAALLPESISK